MPLSVRLMLNAEFTTLNHALQSGHGDANMLCSFRFG